MDGHTLMFNLQAVPHEFEQVFSDYQPRYRLYIDNYLMTERDYLLNDTTLYIREISPFLSNNKSIDFVVEWHVAADSYTIDDISIKDKKIKVEVHENNNKFFKATVHYED